MDKLTITEALSELKTIQKRIDKKQEFIAQYLYRQEQMKDPLGKDGGSQSVISREMQAIHDLQERRIRIRLAIQEMNANSIVEIGGVTRTISEWLTWRREVAPQEQTLLTNLVQKINAIRQDALRRGLAVVAGQATPSAPSDIIVNVNEEWLRAEAEKLEETLGKLDGILSLRNATLVIEVL